MMIRSTVTMPRRVPEPEMLSQLERHKIQVLLEAGHSKREVAERTGASVKTVQRVSHEAAVAHVDGTLAAKERGIGRPSITVHIADSLRLWLADEPTIATQQLLRRAKDAGYKGAKSAFYALVAAMRPNVAPPVVLFDGMPGEFSQHDFGEIDVRFDDHTTRRVLFFASRLKYSRFAIVSVVNDQCAETLIRGLCRHFVAFGGVPLLAVFDRPRTVVLEGNGRSREVRRFNAMFAQAVLEIGVGVEMCAPRSGNQKGSVEAIVKWVKNSFFKGRVFRDEADLQEQLAAWLQEINYKTANRATGVIPEARRLQELPRLRPLGVLPENLAVRVPTSVGPSGHVLHEGARYTMPPEAIHLPATLYLFEDRVRIEAGRFVSEQRRRRKGDPMESPPEHRAARVAAIFGKRGKLYEQRQQLCELGPAALALFTELVHRRTHSWAPAVERLHALLVAHGEDAMRAAIDRAVAEQTFNANAVEEHLSQFLRAPQPNGARAVRRGAQARGQLGLFTHDVLCARAARRPS